MFEVKYASGGSSTHDTIRAARAEIRSLYGGAYVHVCEDGRRLVWESELDSIEDDGSSAIAEIVEVAR